MRDGPGKDFDIDYYFYGWMDSDEARAISDISRFLKNCPHAPIVMIGHSYGGDAAFDVAFSDLPIGVPDLLLTLDPVSHSAIIPRGFRKTIWVNTYLDNSMLLDLSSGPLMVVKLLFASCDSVATWGGTWGQEDEADVNIFASEADGHCDLFGLYQAAHPYVLKALSGGYRNE